MLCYTTLCPVQAARALEVCLRTIAPKILTWGQYAEAAYNLFQKAVMGRDLPEYVPDFTQCINHFALHAGESGSCACCSNLHVGH